MCRHDPPCPLLDFATLRALTLAVTESPGWRGRAVSVGLCRHPDYDGYVLGRVIRYADPAPACTITHELGHILTRTTRHDDEFWQAQAEADRLAADVWRSRLAHRGPA
jgi:hypothetical protein